MIKSLNNYIAKPEHCSSNLIGYLHGLEGEIRESYWKKNFNYTFVVQGQHINVFLS